MFHGLKYTHSQFRLWDINHNRKSCSESGRNPSCKNPDADEGEHDFVVFGPDYIVLIEVKNPSLLQATTSKTNEGIEESLDHVPERMGKMSRIHLYFRRQQAKVTKAKNNV